MFAINSLAGGGESYPSYSGGITKSPSDSELDDDTKMDEARLGLTDAVYSTGSGIWISVVATVSSTLWKNGGPVGDLEGSRAVRYDEPTVPGDEPGKGIPRSTNPPPSPRGGVPMGRGMGRMSGEGLEGHSKGIMSVI